MVQTWSETLVSGLIFGSKIKGFGRNILCMYIYEILGSAFSFSLIFVPVCPEDIRPGPGLFTVGIFWSFFISFFSHSHDSHYFSLLFSFILSFH